MNMRMTGMIGFCAALFFATQSQFVTQSFAADFPEWAYPTSVPVGVLDAKELKTLPGSKKQFTRAQIENNFNPPDWYPEDHPAMPPVVEFGMKPDVKACSKCHISSGTGHPESSDLAGLPIAYFKAQMESFKNGDHTGKRAESMVPIAKGISDADVLAAAEYYHGLKRREWTKVVETETAPKSEMAMGAVRMPSPGGGTEPINGRIIELPQNPDFAILRDSRVGFVAYVPKGSVARGEVLVESGANGKTVACATCHGADLKGDGDVPHIVGRSPTYMFRQMYDLKVGVRKGPNAESMHQVVADLSQDDIVAIAAYLATRAP